MGTQSKILEARINELEGICADAYIAVGELADRAGVRETESVLKLMDNLCYAKAVHKDVIPFELPAVKTDADRAEQSATDQPSVQIAVFEGTPAPLDGTLESAGEIKNVQQEGTGG